MKRIYLFCAGGLSTSIIVNNMKQEAKKRGLEMEIEAHPIDKLSQLKDEPDCILLAPQISYRLDEVRNEVNVPVIDIDLPTYGMMDGVKALDLALNIMSE